ncbi:MAG: hypothetical protein ACRENC_07230, partial [Gemmatimonadaceae bacterium]
GMGMHEINLSAVLLEPAARGAERSALCGRRPLCRPARRGEHAFIPQRDCVNAKVGTADAGDAGAPCTKQRDPVPGSRQSPRQIREERLGATEGRIAVRDRRNHRSDEGDAEWCHTTRWQSEARDQF